MNLSRIGQTLFSHVRKGPSMTTEDSTTGISCDAIAVLTTDHERIKLLFREFARLDPVTPAMTQMELVREIWTELTIHAAVEEELFYPAVRKLINDDELINKAEIEHGTMKYLLEQLRYVDSGDPHLRAKLNVLRECTQHHINDEESEMFPRVKQAKSDLLILGQMIMDRKEALYIQLTEQLLPPPPAAARPDTASAGAGRQ
ncbi:hemerythrin domain-containing protein [Massilia horti]|uniref:Hemerythrin domain-containing protein n=2 Tax=Massilia horti TaxID=2562153 RepID=A0A4Y9T445_9BURK|nr:hemerythrin domain-containing protein [Massilia horti]